MARKGEKKPTAGGNAGKEEIRAAEEKENGARRFSPKPRKKGGRSKPLRWARGGGAGRFESASQHSQFHTMGPPDWQTPSREGRRPSLTGFSFRVGGVDQTARGEGAGFRVEF